MVSAVVGVLAFGSTSGGLADTTDQFLRTRASDIAEALREAVDNNDAVAGNNDDNDGRGSRPNRPSRISGGRPFADDDAIIQITTANGRTVSSGIALPATENSEFLAALAPGTDRVSSLARFDDIEIGGDPYRMVSRPLADGGVIQVARSVGEAVALESTLLRRFTVIATLVALAAAMAGWLIAARVTAPLRRLSAVASDVARTGDFSTEVGDADRDDEIGQLAESFRAMLNNLEASREQQHRLIHDAGHELRTPLTSLRANVAMLERAVDLPSEQRGEILTAIRSELVELSDLFDEMIELATDQRDVDFTPVPVDLDSVVRTVVNRWERRSDRPINIDSVSCVVAGDDQMLQRAVTNLISNADKFSPAGTPIDVVARGGVLSVRDSGPGIPFEDRALVFDRFHRSEITRSMPGSGLGLSIVAQIVELHGGNVFVVDSPTGGADVGFRLQPLPVG